MNAIVPLNIAALRVSNKDNSHVVGQFKGRTSVFEHMPYKRTPSSSDTPGSGQASTGDKIYRPLESEASPQDPLGTGVHLHWELPDFFRRGVQAASGGPLVFPPVPNRWLVTRYFSPYDPATRQYGPISTKSWVVESDYVAPDLDRAPADGVVRPAVAVPLPAPGSRQPFQFLGRVLDYASWRETSSPTNSSYLPAYRDAAGQPYQLTAVGFVGPSFSAYYPECLSVFGFWDHFKDLPDVYQALNGNLPLQFKATYQVTGWLADATLDPLANLPALRQPNGDKVSLPQQIAKQYEALRQQVLTEQGKVQQLPQTPADIFHQLAREHYRWQFSAAAVAFTTGENQALQTLEVPRQTLCAGLLQELIWQLPDAQGNTCFLGNSPASVTPSAVWTEDVTLALGNTTTEALAALLRQDLDPAANDPSLLKNYEYLLNALQLGALAELENGSSSLFDLDETLHTRAFARRDGGQCWVVKQQQPPPPARPAQPPAPDQEVTLPLALAGQLAALNQAQKAYDQGRAQLQALRSQLFMDWLRYATLAEAQESNLTANDLIAFIGTATGVGELQKVLAAGQQVGRLQPVLSADEGKILDLPPPAGAAGSLAYQVWQQYQALRSALQAHADWELQRAPAPPFWLATEPVLLLEGQHLEPVRRNGRVELLPVRVSSELLTSLRVATPGQLAVSVLARAMGAPVALSPDQPQPGDVQALLAESYLLAPMFAPALAAALTQALGRPATDNNPLTAALQAAQGGFNPLEKPAAGLFAAARQPGYVAGPNPALALPGFTATLSNAAETGWLPAAVGWSAPQAVPGLPAGHLDPFLPVFLTWKVRLDPLRRNNAAAASYSARNLTDYFTLEADSTDYRYAPDTAASFTEGVPLDYQGSMVLSKQPASNLLAQIAHYQQTYPDDTSTNAALQAIADGYGGRQLLSLALNGFNAAQLLRTYQPKVAVANLVKGSQDRVTLAVNEAARTGNAGDNWYDGGFNGEAPISYGLLAQHNFGPLRAGFLQVRSLEVVDVFGQRLQLNTGAPALDGALTLTPARSLHPLSDDQGHPNQAYLPPRLLVPSRLWFRWLAGRPAAGSGGLSADFVEMNAHPATSPVCGWVLPNHLDNSLFFYDDDGRAIGSFGLEHHAVVYRTRAGNLGNMRDELAQDLGAAPEGGAAAVPLVNPHVAAFMRYLGQQPAAFLRDLLQAIQNSEAFLNAPGPTQDAGLAVLIGRPLALTRALLALETSGGVLPLSQTDTADTPEAAFPQAVRNQRTAYLDRQQDASADLGAVQFPVRLGELAKASDGLVAFLPEGPGPQPYGPLYAPAATPAAGSSGVAVPTATTLQLTLNGPAQYLTLLLDPHAAVHATTGILPVEQLQIPADQFAGALRRLAVTFFTHPVLRPRRQLVVPLPEVGGYDWSWVAPGGADAPEPLVPQQAYNLAAYDYSPQSLQEGWLQLQARPATPEAAG